MKIILLVLFLTAGCKKFEGNMNVLDHLVYKNSKGESQVLVIGEYDTKVKLKKDKHIVIKASNIFENVKIKLKINKQNNRMLTLNQDSNIIDIFLPKESNGQPFDVKGTITTEVIEGEIITETQLCSSSPRWQIDCQWRNEDPTPPYSGPNSSCYGIPTGEREVTFQVNTNVESLDLEFINDDRTLAAMEAKNQRDEKVYLNFGRCSR